MQAARKSLLLGIGWIYPPPGMPVANIGLGWDSVCRDFPDQNCNNPGGDWHPERGVRGMPLRISDFCWVPVP